MNKIQKINPILVTGAERSGSTLIARILDMCGVWSGDCNRMYENDKLFRFIKRKSPFFPDSKLITPFISLDGLVLNEIKQQDWYGKDWMVKGSKLAQYWPLWYYSFPNAKWIIVRRRTGDIIQSCIKTGYMKLFKNPDNLELLGFEDEAQGWLWWVHQYEKKFVEMMQSGVNCKVVWPDRMVVGDYDQMKEMVDWLGLKWNDKIPEVFEPLLEKSRRVA